MKSHRYWKIAAIVVGLVVVLLVVVASFLDEPLREYAERQANETLQGYRVTIGALDLHPLTLSVDVRDVVVRQEAHPEPILVTIPRVTADAHVLPLFTGTLSAGLDVEGISMSATRQQVDKALDMAKPKQPEEKTAAWQDTLRDMTAFRIAFSLSHGEIRYEGPPADEPVLVHDLNVKVENVTNRPDERDGYPSTLSVAARVLEEARLELNGKADLLAKPHPAVDADIGLRGFKIEAASAAAGRTDLPLKEGILEAAAHVEYASDRKSVTVHEVALRHPRIEYVNTPKAPDIPQETKEQARQWQDMVTGLFPVTIERLSIEDGEVMYRHSPSIDPIRMRDVNVTAGQIRNTESKPGDFPSDLHVSAHLDQATVTADGRADFLAKPVPGADLKVKVQNLPLKPLNPVAAMYHVQLRDGAFGMSGRVKYSPQTILVALDEFLLDGAKVDYVHAAATKDKEKARVTKGAQKAQAAHQDSTLSVKIEHGKIVNSEMGFVNKATSPDYRVFMADMSLDMDHFSNRLEDGTGVVKLTGKFMGSGPTVVSGTFRPEKPKPDFDLEVKIVKTKVQTMNNLLRAYGDIDTTNGLFAFFSQLSVKNGRIEGYVKPLLKDVEVYDPRQDKDKAVSQRLYEAVVGGVLGVFENNPRNELATKTDVSGPVENPKAHTWQVVGNLVQNAFFKAILPGFSKGHVG